MSPAVFVGKGLPELIVDLLLDTPNARRRNKKGILVVDQDVGAFCCVVDLVVVLWE
jgi:hypothetical protein